MKKLLIILPLALILCFMVGCQDKEAYVERFMEDGVEVIMNLPVPQDELENPVLAQILSIDTENEKLAEYGLNDIWGYDVNSLGEIFIFRHPAGPNDFIFKFDKTGEFIKSFGKTGQGPGEIQYPSYQKINFRSEVSVIDMGNVKELLYDSNGNLISETKLVIPQSGFGQVLIPFPNGNYLFRKFEIVPSENSYGLTLLILDSDSEEIVELGGVTIANPVGNKNKYKYRSPYFVWGLSKEYIFVGIEENGYDIHVYDFAGQLIRKIRKEYTPVPFSEEQRERTKEEYKTLPSYYARMIFPKHNPPFQHLFSDELGRLYVVTLETGNNEGEYIIDVFNPDGVLFSRLSVKMFINNELFTMHKPWDSWVTVKNDKLYCIQQKESGHKELVAYEIKWK
jgi:hypothetical protein